MSIKPGSKYYPLFQRLQGCGHEAVTLTFSEIEAMIEEPLPASAFNKKNWWSNRDSSGALQAGAWVHAGYHVQSVELSQQTVAFQRFQAQYNIQQKDGEIIWKQDAIQALRKHMGLTQAEFAQRLGVRRQTVSEWENGVYDPDRSTTHFLELIAQQSNFPTPPAKSNPTVD
jgi:DNA-binding transcriptional regulator YiaG